MPDVPEESEGSMLAQILEAAAPIVATVIEEKAADRRRLERTFQLECLRLWREVTTGSHPQPVLAERIEKLRLASVADAEAASPE